MSLASCFQMTTVRMIQPNRTERVENVSLRQTIRRAALFIAYFIAIVLLFKAACFGYVTWSLNRASSVVEKSGAEVRWLMFQPEYIYFDRNVNDATLSELAPALRELWTVTEIHLEKSQVTDDGIIHLRDMQNLYCVVVADTAITDHGLTRLQQMLPRGQELQVVR